MPQLPVTIIGNLTKAPRLKKFGENRYCCEFRLAASRSYLDGGEWRQTDQLFISVEAWGQLARNIKSSIKQEQGVTVIVSGILTTHEWVDAQGNPQSRTILRANSVGIDLAKYLVGWQRTGAQPSGGADGVSAPETFIKDSDVDHLVDEFFDSPANTASESHEKQATPF
ncbi:single-stranded DNA-binding protein [Corynebacterium poyangense]|uniref:Single-stranded DNA-binding protein n=1 Tax=Corynebacterium poyangense TaxID=2684405 RepID=A0A7H0SQN5_9CORY|nr:single-stranded DNA-binding protein [Corynebacterium poyangense]MBZ8178245.1 single-stranded DNA-binding protein [Corynebacterium poyangense]QNQ90860.1 single-stranded DNA-binding protein [Corynebacterium poyangense]